MIAFPTFTTMFLAGVWHGAGLQFIVYGVLQGIYLTLNHLWRLFHKPLNVNAPHSAGKVYSVLWRLTLTYLAVLLAQIAFRANDVADALTLAAGMLGLHGSGLPLTIPLGNVKYLGQLSDWMLGHHILTVGLRSAYNATTLPLARNYLFVFALALIAFLAPNAYQILNKWSPALNKVKPLRWQFLAWRPSWFTALGAGSALFAATQFFNQTARFLYFQF